MRRTTCCLILLASLGGGGARAAEPPHAWLFGVWTGGLFPVLDTMAAQDCRTQPTLAFRRDVVSHATLLNSAMADRLVETARATPEGVEFTLVPNGDATAGFGCENPDVLHVARMGANAISLPRCTAFPYPLQRCQPE